MDHPLARAGAASIETPSSGFRPERGLGLAAELPLLLGIGGAAALLHEAFRWPLHLPGHHGLEWLAILMAARLLSSRPWAAMAVAVGAALMAAAGHAGHDTLLRPLVYLLQGAVLDGLWRVAGSGRMAPWRAALLGAGVHALSPLAMWLLAAAGGVQAGAVANGLAAPLASHAAYGAVGAAFGAAAALAWRRSRRH